MNHLVLAGLPDKNPTLYRKLGLPLGDPAAFASLGGRNIAIVRDLEMDRTRQLFEGQVFCPADFEPDEGLSADRETATAQALAEMLQRESIESVTSDRSFPFVFAWHLRTAGITVNYDPDLGVVDRRSKTPDEVELLRRSQAVTEVVMRWTLERIANADVDDEGRLIEAGEILTSESIRRDTAIEFMNRGFTTPHGSICASVPDVADCHHRGTGPLRTGVPIIVDLFPCSESTRYWGDCTRTIVHGRIPVEVAKAHQTVVAAKAACTARLVAGTSAHNAHLVSEQVLIDAGYESFRGSLTDELSIQHGTGHGIGLECHEPILLDCGGGEMLAGEVFTVEPGLYGRQHGGVRVEDMVVVGQEESRNLNRLEEGLQWA